MQPRCVAACIALIAEKRLSPRLGDGLMYGCALIILHDDEDRLMSEVPSQPPRRQREFVPRKSVMAKAVGFGLLGGASILIAAVGMIFNLGRDTDQITLHVMTTLPTMVGVFSLGACWNFARAPKRVVLSPDGITIEHSKDVTHYAWNDIGWVQVGVAPMTKVRQIKLCDRNGKLLTNITEVYKDFDRMIDIVNHMMESKSDTTIADGIRSRKSKRNAILFFGFGALMLLAGGFIAYDARETQRTAMRLADEGIPGEGEIVDRRLAPNGVTPRLEYRIAGSNGKSSVRNAEVTRDYWNSLEGATHVPIVYVPDEPSISRLSTGEVQKNEDWMEKPPGAYVFAGMAGLFSLVIFATGVLS